MKRLNIKLAVLLIIGTVLLGVGVHFLHAFQVERHAGGLLQQAMSERDAGNTKEALAFCDRYLNHRNKDPEGWALKAELHEQMTEAPGTSRRKKMQTAALMEHALRLDPDNIELRRKLFDYSMKLNAGATAIEHGKLLRAAGQADADLEFSMGICASMTADTEGAMQTFADMVGYNLTEKTFDLSKAKGPNKPEAYLRLAMLLREKRADEIAADQVIEQLIAVNEKSHEAHLVQYSYWASHREPQRAKAALDQAFELNPDAAEVILHMAERALRNRETDEAERLLARGVELHPKNERMHVARAISAFRQGKVSDAKDRLEAGLAELPESQLLLTQAFDMLLKLGDVTNAEKRLKTLIELESGALPIGLVDLYEGQLLVAKKNFSEAIEKLEKARVALVQSGEHRKMIDLLLAQSHAALGQGELALNDYRRVQLDDETSIEALLGIAQSLYSTGKLDEALNEYERLAQAVGAERMMSAPQVWLPLINLRLIEQARRPKDQRDWKRVDSLVAQIKNASNVPELNKTLIEAEVLARKGDLIAARKLLDQALEKSPNEVSVWTTLCALEAQTEGPRKALYLASTAPPEIRDGVPMRLQRAGLVNRLPAEEAAAGLAALEIGMSQLKPEEQNALMQGLAVEYQRRNDRDNAKRLLKVLMTRLPNDLVVRSTYLGIAKSEFDVAEMQKVAIEVRKIVGAESSQAQMVDAVCKITEVMRNQRDRAAKDPLAKIDLSESDRALLAEAQTLLEGLSKARSGWTEPHLQLADIRGLQNDVAGVISELQLAFKKGAIEPGRQRQLYQLLVATNQFDAAQEVEKAMAGQNTAGLERAQIEVALNAKRMDEAKARLAEAKPKDDAPVADQLWYASAQRRVGDFVESEAALRRVVQHDPKLGEGWLLLVNTLAMANKKAEAQQVIDDAKTRFEGDSRDLLVAQSLEMIGEPKQAEEFYLKTVAVRPKDLAANQAVAAFYLRNNKFEQVLPYLDTLMREGANANDPREKEAVNWARRARAVAMVSSKGGWQRFQEAQVLLSQQTGEPTTADIMLQIGLFANRTEPASMRAALKLLEDLETRQPLQASELATMAVLYERVGNWQRANDTMLNVLSQQNTQPSHFLVYAEMLMRAGQTSEVATWLSRYEASVPKDNGTLALRATLLVKQDRAAEGVALLRKALGPTPWKADKLTMARNVAALLENLSQYRDAEQILREVAKIDPRGELPLARFIGTYGNLDEAFAMLDKNVAESTPGPVMGAALQVLRARRGDTQPAHFALVAKWYAALSKANPDSAQVQAMMGDIREIRGELPEAEKIYRQVLARKDLTPELRAMLSNNLAYVLGFEPNKAPEAIQLVGEAMKVIGPTSDLLDTRGTIYLTMGKTNEALADLREAILQPSALKYVHFAFAQQQAHDSEGAKQSLEKAHELKLKLQDLHPNERVKYDALAKELGV